MKQYTVKGNSSRSQNIQILGTTPVCKALKSSVNENMCMLEITRRENLKTY